METIMNQLFSPELIPDYMHAHPEYGVKRILTYTVYRFLSFAGKEDDTLAAYIKETLFPMEDALDFSLISDYLALDPYFVRYRRRAVLMPFSYIPQSAS